ncbi:type IV secretory pathway VirB10-like protein [Bradyrhizobium elkanii]
MISQSGNDHEQADPPETQEEQSKSFRLRAEHPRVTRLSRKVLAGGSALALFVIGGAVLWSLQNNRPRNQAADELYSTDHHNVADGLTTLPKDYAGVPRQPIPQLGPPLPGIARRSGSEERGDQDGESVSRRDDDRRDDCRAQEFCLL